MLLPVKHDCITRGANLDTLHSTGNRARCAQWSLPKNKFIAFSSPSSCLGSYHFLDLFSSQASVETSVKDIVGPFVTKRKPFEQKLSTHNKRKAIHAKLSQMIFTIRHT